MNKGNEATQLILRIDHGVNIEGPADEVRRIAHLLETAQRPMTQDGVAASLREVLRPLIEASKVGKAIQYRNRPSGSWLDCIARKTRHEDFDLVNNEYRVKPEPREAWVRLDGPAPAIYLDEDMDEATAQGLGYVRMREVGQE